MPLVGKKDATLSRRSDRSPLDFPRGCRILRRSDFQAAYRDGRRKSNQPFLVFIRPNGRTLSRFGMSVKKSQGGAVLRNRIRRRVREIVRLHRQEIAPGWDIVIHPRSSAATADFPSLATALLDLLPRPPVTTAGNTIGT